MSKLNWLNEISETIKSDNVYCEIEIKDNKVYIYAEYKGDKVEIRNENNKLIIRKGDEI